MSEHIIYLDNAATTYPKPRHVLEAMISTYARMGVSPGRGSYDLAVEAENVVQETRVKATRFFGAPDPGTVINPVVVISQLEGGMPNSKGCAGGSS